MTKWPRAVGALAMMLAAAGAQGRTRTVKSAERTLVILTVLSSRASTFTELHHSLHYPRASLHGLLSTLVRQGWVRRGVDNRYRVVVALAPTANGDPA